MLSMTDSSKNSSSSKNLKTDRQKRLSEALRQNLRKRKEQMQQRAKTKPSPEGTELISE